MSFLNLEKKLKLGVLAAIGLSMLLAGGGQDYKDSVHLHTQLVACGEASGVAGH